MKKIIIVLVFVIVFIGSICLGKYLYTDKQIVEKIDEALENNATKNLPKENTYIIEKKEINTLNLVEDENHVSYYEVNLVANDMQLDTNVYLSYKIITNMTDYNKYKERITLPEITEDKFNDVFMVIIFNQENRSKDEIDLTIDRVKSDDTTTHIIMKQKENHSIYSENNVFWAVVDKSQLKENISIEIE